MEDSMLYSYDVCVPFHNSPCSGQMDQKKWKYIEILLCLINSVTIYTQHLKKGATYNQHVNVGHMSKPPSPPSLSLALYVSPFSHMH